jgi:gliding motility associated protien GldN
MKIFLKILVIGAFILIAASSYSQVLDTGPRDGIYDKTAILQMNPIPYVPLREADVIWSRRIWREINMREKLNQPFYYPETPQGTWKSFMQIVLDNLKEGTITAYEDDKFILPRNYNEIMKSSEKTIKKTLIRPGTEIEYDTSYTETFQATAVTKLKLKEQWVFDRQRSVLEVRILGICPVKESYTDQGEYRGDMDMFWIYFPECRNIFSKMEQFNLKNGDAGRLSYDDVFMKRMFSSFIYKEENVYDRKIADYAMGVDALLEADRAKASLHEFEMSLWEY